MNSDRALNLRPVDKRAALDVLTPHPKPKEIHTDVEYRDQRRECYYGAVAPTQV
jgi:hypothetical protein